jgi:hypothetical protein
VVGGEQTGVDRRCMAIRSIEWKCHVRTKHRLLRCRNLVGRKDGCIRKPQDNLNSPPELGDMLDA